ncbi:unnamed protein product, partial [Mesorhabditis belari]|uniref:WAP domain-containing protein n=1 Tax=Mesorhabditis belari TaxID=2138241 RepID=A0AAF3J6Z6_9BILA
MLHVVSGFFVLVGCAMAMDLCEYFARLGFDKPECRQQIVFRPTEFQLFDGSESDASREQQVFYHPTAFEVLDGGRKATTKVLTFHRFPHLQIDPPQQFEVIGRQGFDYPLCKNFFHSCMESGKCESGNSKCPSIAEIGVNCRKPKSVNWCYADSDCRGRDSLSGDLCCPTGCNYNICVHSIEAPKSQIALLADNMGFSSFPLLTPPPQQPPSTPASTTNHHIVFSRLLAQEQCPDPWKIEVKCNVRQPTSWCAKHSDCPDVNTVNPRKCCPTVCGYTACMVKYNNKWMIA